MIAVANDCVLLLECTSADSYTTISDALSNHLQQGVGVERAEILLPDRQSAEFR